MVTNTTPDLDVDEIGSEVELPYYDVSGSLIGKTRADNWKHAQARSVLLESLSLDPRIMNLMEMWGESTGLAEAAASLAACLDRLADGAELETRGHFVELLSRGTAEDVPTAMERIVGNLNSVQISETVYECKEMDEANQASDIFDDRIEHMDAEGMAKDVMALVREEFDLPWPWLCIELLIQFYLGTWGFATGRTFTIAPWVEDPPIPVPPLEMAFRTEPETGETIGVAIDRLILQSAEVLSELVQHAEEHFIPNGRFPGVEGIELIRRNVTWFYKSRLCDVPIAHLARQYHEDVHGADSPPDDDRKTIRHGIDVAARLLGQANFRFDN